MPIALLIFIAIPILEIGLFIQVGGWIGLWPTLAIILATALIGTSLLRRQGLAVLASAQASAERGDVPVREVFDGVCLLVAGAFLLTPGFFTDTIGFSLMVPGVRQVLGRRLWAMIRRGIESGRINMSGSFTASAANAAQARARHGAHSADPMDGPIDGPMSGPGASPPPKSPGTSAGERATVIDAEFEEIDPGRRPGPKD